MTNIETVMKKALDSAKIPYEQEYPLRTGFVADFALIDHRLIIECDGETWHGTAKAKKRDRFRDWMLRRSGWHTIRFSGQCILDDIESCILEIRNIISN